MFIFISFSCFVSLQLSGQQPYQASLGDKMSCFLGKTGTFRQFVSLKKNLDKRGSNIIP